MLFVLGVGALVLALLILLLLVGVRMGVVTIGVV
jgi:hypothetical protein